MVDLAAPTCPPWPALSAGATASGQCTWISPIAYTEPGLVPVDADPGLSSSASASACALTAEYSRRHLLQR